MQHSTIDGVPEADKPVPLDPDLSVRQSLERLGISRRAAPWNATVDWAEQVGKHSPGFFAAAYVAHLLRHLFAGMSLEDAAALRAILAPPDVPPALTNRRQDPEWGRA